MDKKILRKFDAQVYDSRRETEKLIKQKLDYVRTIISPGDVVNVKRQEVLYRKFDANYRPRFGMADDLMVILEISNERIAMTSYEKSENRIKDVPYNGGYIPRYTISGDYLEFIEQTKYKVDMSDVKINWANTSINDSKYHHV